MKIQLDTNIVIDILEERIPFVLPIRKLLSVALLAGHSFYVPACSIDNIAYVLRKNFTSKEIAAGLKKFFQTIHISPVNDKIIKLALDADWKDLEDAIQYYAAQENDVDLIVTRDLKGYERQKLKILTPEEALNLVNN